MSWMSKTGQGKKAYVCTQCVFEWLQKIVVGKRVMVKVERGYIIGTLVSVEYQPKAARRLNTVLTLENANGKITVAKFDSVSILGKMVRLNEKPAEEVSSNE